VTERRRKPAVPAPRRLRRREPLGLKSAKSPKSSVLKSQPRLVKLERMRLCDNVSSWSKSVRCNVLSKNGSVRATATCDVI